MVDPEGFGQFLALSARKPGQLGLHQRAQPFLKILQKQLVVPAGEQLQNVVVIPLQMLKEMEKEM